MSLIDGLSEGVVNVSKVTLLSPFEPLNNRLMQLQMVAFKGEYVVSTPVNNGLGNVLLTVERIHRDNTALEKQRLEQFWHYRNFIRLLIDLALPKQQPAGMGEGTHQMNGILGSITVPAVACYLSIHGDDLSAFDSECRFYPAH